MTKNGIKTEHRLTSLETKVDAILSNHLPHIQVAIESLESKIDGIKLGVPAWFSIVVSICTALAVYVITK